MKAENQIISVEFDVNKRIDARVEEILEGESITLPGVGHPLVDDYVQKIEGTYDVTRSKDDTDNAIDLLYIAYNTTPQEEGNIRVGIDDLMADLIQTQQDSELEMKKATEFAGHIPTSLSDTFGDWKEARDSDNSQDLKDFVGEGLFDLAEEIKSKAEQISGSLAKIAEAYDGIIDRTTKTTHQGEKALARRLKNKKDIEKEIVKNNADRAKLESLVEDLQNDIKKYDKMANEYKSRAETAEERAFIMSIVRVGAQMISSTVPAITQAVTTGITGAATGGTSLIAAAAAGTVRQMTNSVTATTDSDNTAEVIETKKDIADKRAEKNTAEREKKELEKKAGELTDERAKIEGDEETDVETKATQLEAVDKRIEANEAEIKKKNSAIDVVTAALDGLNAALKTLDKTMGEMAEKQEQQGTNLRDLQMKMLEKVEAYETEKRTQAAELVKINALLTGQRTEEETIQLAIKSLNLSLKALKRMREIILEISFFFKSFASFMQQVMENSGEESKLIQKAIDRDTLSKSFTRRIKRNTNDFFVTQTAEWHAVEIVSAKFVDNFAEGWSKLNKLSGTYLTGAELKSYFDVAALKIADISLKRKQAANAKLAELNRYRDRIRAET